MDRYRIIRRVGQGSHGQWSLVEDRRSRKVLVLKQIPLDHLHMSRHGRALNEAALLQRLDHPNIIRYYDSFIHEQPSVTVTKVRTPSEHAVDPSPADGPTEMLESERLLCLVMEFAEGGDLAKEVARRQGGTLVVTPTTSTPDYLSEDEVLLLFIQLVLALRYLHQRRVLHRDIKLSNVFLGNGFVTKLGDFGIGTQLDNEMATPRLRSRPCSMAPEVHLQKPYDDRSDIWALGCVLYEMCSLEPAFKGDTLAHLAETVCNPCCVPKWNEEVARQYSADLKALCEALLTPSPSERPSASAIVASSFIQTSLCSVCEKFGTRRDGSVNAVFAHLWEAIIQNPNPQLSPVLSPVTMKQSKLIRMDRNVTVISGSNTIQVSDSSYATETQGRAMLQKCDLIKKKTTPDVGSMSLHERAADEPPTLEQTALLSIPTTALLPSLATHDVLVESKKTLYSDLPRVVSRVADPRRTDANGVLVEEVRDDLSSSVALFKTASDALDPLPVVSNTDSTQFLSPPVSSSLPTFQPQNSTEHMKLVKQSSMESCQDELEAPHSGLRIENKTRILLDKLEYTLLRQLQDLGTEDAPSLDDVDCPFCVKAFSSHCDPIPLSYLALKLGRRHRRRRRCMDDDSDAQSRQPSFSKQQVFTDTLDSTNQPFDSTVHKTTTPAYDEKNVSSDQPLLQDDLIVLRSQQLLPQELSKASTAVSRLLEADPDPTKLQTSDTLSDQLIQKSTGEFLQRQSTDELDRLSPVAAETLSAAVSPMTSSRDVVDLTSASTDQATAGSVLASRSGSTLLQGRSVFETTPCTVNEENNVDPDLSFNDSVYSKSPASPTSDPLNNVACTKAAKDELHVTTESRVLTTQMIRDDAASNSALCPDASTQRLSETAIQSTRSRDSEETTNDTPARSGALSIEDEDLTGRRKPHTGRVPGPSFSRTLLAGTPPQRRPSQRVPTATLSLSETLDDVQDVALRKTKHPSMVADLRSPKDSVEVKPVTISKARTPLHDTLSRSMRRTLPVAPPVSSCRVDTMSGRLSATVGVKTGSSLVSPSTAKGISKATANLLLQTDALLARSRAIRRTTAENPASSVSNSLVKQMNADHRPAGASTSFSLSVKTAAVAAPSAGVTTSSSTCLEAVKKKPATLAKAKSQSRIISARPSPQTTATVAAARQPARCQSGSRETATATVVRPLDFETRTQLILPLSLLRHPPFRHLSVPRENARLNPWRLIELSNATRDRGFLKHFNQKACSIYRWRYLPTVTTFAQAYSHLTATTRSSLRHCTSLPPRLFTSFKNNPSVKHRSVTEKGKVTKQRASEKKASITSTTRSPAMDTAVGRRTLMSSTSRPGTEPISVVPSSVRVPTRLTNYPISQRTGEIGQKLGAQTICPSYVANESLKTPKLEAKGDGPCGKTILGRMGRQSGGTARTAAVRTASTSFVSNPILQRKQLYHGGSQVSPTAAPGSGVRTRMTISTTQSSFPNRSTGIQGLHTPMAQFGGRHGNSTPLSQLTFGIPAAHPGGTGRNAMVTHPKDCSVPLAPGATVGGKFISERGRGPSSPEVQEGTPRRGLPSAPLHAPQTPVKEEHRSSALNASETLAAPLSPCKTSSEAASRPTVKGSRVKKPTMSKTTAVESPEVLSVEAIRAAYRTVLQAKVATAKQKAISALNGNEELFLEIYRVIKESKCTDEDADIVMALKATGVTEKHLRYIYNYMDAQTKCDQTLAAQKPAKG